MLCTIAKSLVYDMEQDQPGRFHSYGSKNEDSIWVKSTVDYHKTLHTDHNAKKINAKY